MLPNKLKLVQLILDVQDKTVCCFLILPGRGTTHNGLD